MAPHKYGDRYWCIKTDLSPDGEIYVYGDKIQMSPNGDLAFIRAKGEDREECIMLALAKGQWKCFFAASVMDGSAVAVEHWKGEVIREDTKFLVK